MENKNTIKKQKKLSKGIYRRKKKIKKEKKRTKQSKIAFKKGSGQLSEGVFPIERLKRTIIYSFSIISQTLFYLN